MLLPQLGPAIFASLMVTFATSVDDFVISSFLSTGASTETVPIKIYSGARAGATPAVNALATVMLMFTLLAVVLAALALRKFGKNGPDDGYGEPHRHDHLTSVVAPHAPSPINGARPPRGVITVRSRGAPQSPSPIGSRAVHLADRTSPWRRNEY